MLPGERAVLYSADFDEGNSRVRAVLLETGERVDVLPNGSQPRYVRTGHLVYNATGTLWAVAFDAERLTPIGDPVPVLEGVSWDAVGSAQYSISDDGSLTYFSRGTSDGGYTLVWVDRDGEETPLPLPPRYYSGPRLSPDGRRVAVLVRERAPSTRNLWVFDVVSAAGARITDGGDANTVVWTPDGDNVVFSWNDPPGDGFWDLHVAPADGGEIRRVTTTPDVNEQPTSVTPDGQSIVTVAIADDGSRDVMTIPVDGEGERTMILQGGGFRRGNASVSPDGNWLAYRSDQTGQLEIYLQAYPGPGPTVPVSTGGGDMVIWSSDGSELFYRRGTAVMAVPVDRDGTVGSASKLFDGGHSTAPGGVRQYHVAPDGRFLMLSDRAGGPSEARLILVLNWFAELERLVPVE